jgi:hypothetical protein
MKAVTSLLGGGSKPKTDPAPIAATEEEKKKAKTARSQLLETEGGIIGSELTTGQTGGRSTLFGN